MLTFLGWVLGAVVVKRFPENFEWQVKSAIQKGDLHRAEAIALKQMTKEHYDFGAHRLFARVMLEADKPDRAVDTLLMSLDRMEIASGRPVYTRGADPVATYELLREALLEQGQTEFAGEVQRIAEDYEQVSTIEETSNSVTEANLSTSADAGAAPDGLALELEKIQLEGGVTLTSSGTLHFSAESSATVDSAEIQVGENSKLHLLISGEKALGLGGILKVSLGDDTIFLAYGDTPEPRWVVVPLTILEGQVRLPLTMQFVNDAYDPVTNSDRNVEIHKIILQQQP